MKLPSPDVKTISQYNAAQPDSYKQICELLNKEINRHLPKAESKLWHGAPVWFLDGNPVTGYHVLKDGVRLLFWSGLSFEEPSLIKVGKNFQSAGITYTDIGQINLGDLERYLNKAENIQWDYKNLVKRKGELLPVEKI